MRIKSIKIKYSWNPLTYKNSTTYQVASTMLMMHLEILLFIISIDNPGISPSAYGLLF